MAQSHAPDPSANDVSHLTFTVADLGCRPPVQVTQVFVGDREIPLNTPVTLLGNWMKDLHVEVRNTSPKHIVYGNLTVLFPEAGNMTLGLTIGRYPEHALMQKDGTFRPMPAYFSRKQAADIPPGETIDFPIDPDAELAQSSIYQHALRITQVVIKFNGVYFADDSRWSGSSFYAAAPAPTVWTTLTDEAFYAPPGTDLRAAPPIATNEYASRREALLAPEYQALARKDYPEALKICREALIQYPSDGRVLMLAANAARASEQFEEAAGYLRTTVKQEASYRLLHAWGSDYQLLQLDAQLGHWDDFAEVRSRIEKAAVSGDPYLPKALTDGFHLEGFTVGPQPVDVLDFPVPAQSEHVRYSFRLFGRATEAVLIWRMELIELPGSPDKFALEEYGASSQPVVIASYPDGEPAYPEVRAKVLQILEGQLGTVKVTYPNPHF